MPLSDRDRNYCILKEVDPDLLDLIDDDHIYGIGDLIDIWNIDPKTARRFLAGVLHLPLGERCNRYLGRTIKQSILNDIRAGRLPFSNN